MKKVLIVGAGAGGLVTGYYLAQSGADVTFFVRPAKVAALGNSQKLYCYDDCQIRDYDSYQLMSDVAEVASKDFDYVLVTLDGSSACSAEGTALLQGLGAAIRNSEAVMFNLGVGFEIRQHYLHATGLPEERLVCGSFNFLSHFVPGNSLKGHAPVSAEHLAQADVAYRHVNGKAGLLIENNSSSAVKAFVDLYGANGESICKTASPAVVELMGNLLFPVFGAFELAGWPTTTRMLEHKALWKLAAGAMQEIAALPRYGFSGKVASWIPAWLWGKIWLKLEQTSLPLDFTEFNRVHHGGKVVAQDTAIMQSNLDYGRQLGRPMTSLDQLIGQLERKRQAA